MSAPGGQTDVLLADDDFRVCEGLRMPAPDGGAANTGGRRTQTSKGGNRGRCGAVARQTLWGFRRWRSVAAALGRFVWEAIERPKLVGQLQLAKPVSPVEIERQDAIQGGARASLITASREPAKQKGDLPFATRRP